ncbi:hypothetical protein HS041_22330 [Planomonospora sp. ID67723]|uniref:hypothetical protein n=1 Tax=Planomonospora sp. ID67723 TaxID=2738134 RepID=UPI0018C3EE7E|nr:hypothetical protein [Planomonospora sp. ID67723]MBG0830502.1 hypothetical protein [Planomonospora sp. ID67723]
MDQFPAEESRIIRELQRRIERLETLVGQVKGTPVTQTSGPLFIPDGTPSTPSGGAYLFSEGGVFKWRSSGGTTYSGIPPTVPKASFVSDPNPISAGGAPGAYSSAHSEALRTDITHLRTKYIALRDALVSAPLMFPV